MSHSWGQFLFLVSDGLSGSSWISVTVTVSRWAQRLGFGFQGKLNFTRSSHSHEPGVCPRGSGGRGLVVSPEDSVCEGWGAAAGFGSALRFEHAGLVPGDPGRRGAGEAVGQPPRPISSRCSFATSSRRKRVGALGTRAACFVTGVLGAGLQPGAPA